MKKVLVIAPAWVGDMVMAQTLFKSLKHNQVKHLAVLAPKWTLEVASRMPEVDQLILGDFSHGKLDFKKRYHLGQSLKKQFDTAIVLPRSAKAALIPYFAKVPNRIGYLGELRFGLINQYKRLNKENHPRTIDRFNYLIDNCNIENPNLSIDYDNQTRLKNEFNLKAPILAICPGAEYGPSKQWQSEDFAKVSHHFSQKNYQIIALGSASDQQIIQKIKTQAKSVIDLSGKTSITDAIDLLAATSAVLTHDSGLMHIAAAVKTKTFAIYGSTTPKMTPPLSDQATLIENPSITCRPCFKRVCPLKGQEFHQCMKTITAKNVIELMEKAL